MSSDPHNGPEQRDQVVARLAAEELRSKAASSGASNSCPDAEVLAACADRTLDPEQAARWESHFADCPRCRKILAAVLVSADEPLLQQEVQKLGQRAGSISGPVAVPGAAAASKQPLVMRRRSNARWAVPAIAAAAAVLLWFALRPTQPPTQFVTQNVPGDNSALRDAPSPGSLFNPAANSEIAQGAVPAPPPPLAGLAPAGAVAGAAAQNFPGQNTAAASAPALDAAKQQQPATEAPSAPTSAPQDAVSSARAVVPVLPPPVPVTTLQPRVAATNEIPQLETEKTEASAGAQPNRLPAPAGLLGGARLAQSQGLRTSAAPLPLAEKKATPLFTFSSPSGAQWRGGTGGLIERSTDQGRNWQAQVSGVTLDLAAGSASSEQVAWIVGHAGVILRSTDGATWQRITSPNATITDWTAVQATDAQHAIITAKDQRRFTTADGGQSWTPQP